MQIIKPVNVADAAAACWRATANGTYFDKTGTMQTAPANTQRVSYNPGDLGAAPTPLIEPAATNMLAYSNDLSQAAWGKSNLSGVGSKVYDGPAGPNSAWRIADNATSNVHQLRTPSITLTAGVTYTMSAYAKAGTMGFFYIGFSAVFGDGSASNYIAFNLRTGAVALVSNASVSGTIAPAGDDWYFCTVTFTATTTASGTNYAGLQPTSATSGYVGDGSGTMYVANFQLETGTAATSYINTTASATLRAADVFDSATGAGLLYTNIVDGEAVWAADASYNEGDRSIVGTTMYESLRGHAANVQVSSPGMSLPYVFHWTGAAGHRLSVGDAVPLVAGSSGVSNLVVGTTYYVKNVINANDFTVSDTAGGSEVLSVTGVVALAGIFYVVNEAPNGGNDPTLTGSTYWLKVGPTPRFSVFDATYSTTASAAEYVTYIIRPGQVCTGLAVVGVDGSSVRVTMIDSVTGATVYNRVKSLRLKNSKSVSQYLFGEIERRTDEVFDDLPTFKSAIITVTVAKLGGTAAIGDIQFGRLVDIGETQWEPEIRTLRRSKITDDDFGNITFVKRRSSKLLTVDVSVDNDQVDFVVRALNGYTDSPCVIVGDVRWTSLIILGFVQDFRLVLGGPGGSLYNAQIQGFA